MVFQEESNSSDEDSSADSPDESFHCSGDEGGSANTADDMSPTLTVEETNDLRSCLKKDASEGENKKKNINFIETAEIKYYVPEPKNSGRRRSLGSNLEKQVDGQEDDIDGTNDEDTSAEDAIVLETTERVMFLDDLPLLAPEDKAMPDGNSKMELVRSGPKDPLADEVNAIKAGDVEDAVAYLHEENGTPADQEKIGSGAGGRKGEQNIPVKPIITWMDDFYFPPSLLYSDDSSGDEMYGGEKASSSRSDLVYSPDFHDLPSYRSTSIPNWSSSNRHQKPFSPSQTEEDSEVNQFTYLTLSQHNLFTPVLLENGFTVKVGSGSMIDVSDDGAQQMTGDVLKARSADIVNIDNGTQPISVGEQLGKKYRFPEEETTWYCPAINVVRKAGQTSLISAHQFSHSTSAAFKYYGRVGGLTASHSLEATHAAIKYTVDRNCCSCVDNFVSERFTDSSNGTCRLRSQDCLPDQLPGPLLKEIPSETSTGADVIDIDFNSYRADDIDLDSDSSRADDCDAQDSNIVSSEDNAATAKNQIMDESLADDKQQVLQTAQLAHTFTRTHSLEDGPTYAGGGLGLLKEKKRPSAASWIRKKFNGLRRLFASCSGKRSRKQI